MTEGDDGHLEDLLERRAQRVRSPPAPLEEEGAFWVAEFPFGASRCAVPLDQLKAALPLRAVTPVPLAASHVIGVLRFRGQLITAVSLGALLGGAGSFEDPAVLLIVETGDGRHFAVDCEGIPKPAPVPQAVIEAARAQGRAPIVEIALPGGREARLLDLPLLLRGLEARVGG